MIPIYVVRRRHADGDIVVDEAMVVAVVGRLPDARLPRAEEGKERVE